jgi:peptidoglycan hydrolase-like protein with peptidoglycan-binding domain
MTRVRLAGLVAVVLLALSVIALSGGTSAGAAPPNGSVKPLDICNFTTARPTIYRGGNNDPNAVKQAQCYLNSSVHALVNKPLIVDGGFGAKTDAATRFFQYCLDLTIDGRIGPNTWSALSSVANSPNWACNDPN